MPLPSDPERQDHGIRSFHGARKRVRERDVADDYLHFGLRFFISFSFDREERRQRTSQPVRAKRLVMRDAPLDTTSRPRDLKLVRRVYCD